LYPRNTSEYERSCLANANDNEATRSISGGMAISSLSYRVSISSCPSSVVEAFDLLGILSPALPTPEDVLKGAPYGN
jgi:hypothetical protein